MTDVPLSTGLCPPHYRWNSRLGAASRRAVPHRAALLRRPCSSQPVLSLGIGRQRQRHPHPGISRGGSSISRTSSRHSDDRSPSHV